MLPPISVNHASLDPQKIQDLLASENQPLIERFHSLKTVDSTNDYLLRCHAPAGKVIVCASDEQTKGRGRYGRSWHSPAQQGIYCSVLLHWEDTPVRLSTMSLIASVALRRALCSCRSCQEPLERLSHQSPVGRESGVCCSDFHLWIS